MTAPAPCLNRRRTSSGNVDSHHVCAPELAGCAIDRGAHEEGVDGVALVVDEVEVDAGDLDVDWDDATLVEPDRRQKTPAQPTRVRRQRAPRSRRPARSPRAWRRPRPRRARRRHGARCRRAVFVAILRGPRRCVGQGALDAHVGRHVDEVCRVHVRSDGRHGVDLEAARTAENTSRHGKVVDGRCSAISRSTTSGRTRSKTGARSLCITGPAARASRERRRGI